MRFQERAVLPATPERAWTVLVDWERQSAWMPDVVWVRLAGPERGLGARLWVRTKVFGIPAVTDLVRVTAWQPPRIVAVEHEGPVRGLGEWRLEALAGGRTGFTWTEEIRLPVPVLGEIALWLYSPWQRRMLRRSIRNLSLLVEA